MPELLTQEEIETGLHNLHGWKQSGSQIVLELKREDFMDAVGLINKIAEIAEKADHHPNIDLRDYNKLTIFLSTHSKGGITQNDLDLAAGINSLI